MGHSHLLLLLSLFVAALPARGFTKVSPRTDLAGLLRDVAAEAQVRVQIDSSVRGSVAVDLNGVEPLTALTVLCRTNRLEMERTEPEGEIETYRIRDRAVVAQWAGNSISKMVRLRRRPVSQVLAALKPRLRGRRVSVEGDARTNQLLVNASPDDARMVLEIVHQLDA